MNVRVAIAVLIGVTILAMTRKSLRGKVAKVYALTLMVYVAFLSILLWNVQPLSILPEAPNNLIPGNKVLILVPHQDDELNLAAGVLPLLRANKEVYIAYSTNGDWSYDEEQNPDKK